MKTRRGKWIFAVRVRSTYSIKLWGLRHDMVALVAERGTWKRKAFKAVGWYINFFPQINTK